MSTTQIPAEITVDGHGLQKVHVCDPKTGQPLRRITVPGTLQQARDYASRLVLHHTDPDYPPIVASLHGEQHTTPLLHQANVTAPGRGNAFFRALANLPAAV